MKLRGRRALEKNRWFSVVAIFVLGGIVLFLHTVFTTVQAEIETLGETTAGPNPAVDLELLLDQ
jgi:hypothetical protein